MIVTEKHIRHLVREELINVLIEANPHHDPKTGKLSSGDVGDVYSISEPVEKKYGNEAKKGITTSKGKIQAKFGMATGKDACGRRDITGKDIDPVWKCSDYKRRYYTSVKSESIEVGLGKEVGSVDIQDAVVLSNKDSDKTICFKLNDIIDIIQRTSNNKQELAEDSSQNVMSYCNRNSYYTLDQFLRLLSNIEDSKSGKYPQRKEDKD